MKPPRMKTMDKSLLRRKDIETAKVIESLFSCAIIFTPPVTMAQQVSSPPPTSGSKKRKVLDLLKELMSIGEEEESKPTLSRDDVHGIAVGAIRADEHIKLLKTIVEKQGKQIDNMQQAIIQQSAFAKEDKELSNRVLSEANDMKIKARQLEDIVEPLSKRMINTEVQHKAIQGRINAMEDRIRAVEQVQK